MPRPVAWPWPTRRCRWPTWGRPGGGRQGETWACAWCSRPSGARPPREARGRRRGGAAVRAESRRIVVQLVTEENITGLAAERWATARDPRLAELMTALVRHLHAFAREVRLTEAEWMAAVQWLTRTGQISDDKREEFILASDVLGLSMLVVQMNHRLDPAPPPLAGGLRCACPRGPPGRLRPPLRRRCWGPSTSRAPPSSGSARTCPRA